MAMVPVSGGELLHGDGACMGRVHSHGDEVSGSEDNTVSWQLG